MLIHQIYREATDFIDKIGDRLSISAGELQVTEPIANPKNADLRELGLRDTSGVYFVVRPLSLNDDGSRATNSISS